MTATNHAVTGALISLVVPGAIAVPLAFGAHFVMDAVPHFRVTAKNDLDRFQKRSFYTALIGDLILAVIFLITLPIYLRSDVSPWLVALSMFACMSPDLAWGWRLLLASTKKAEKPKNWFSNFHSAIQWSETQKGLYVEIAWLFCVLALIIKLR